MKQYKPNSQIVQIIKTGAYKTPIYKKIVASKKDIKKCECDFCKKTGWTFYIFKDNQKFVKQNLILIEKDYNSKIINEDKYEYYINGIHDYYLKR